MAKIIIEVEDLDPQVVTFRVRQDTPPKTPAEQSNAERIANLLTFQAVKAVKANNPVLH